MSGANFASGTVWTGDNLPVMRGINSACIDLIYLDPPFILQRRLFRPDWLVGGRRRLQGYMDAF